MIVIDSNIWIFAENANSEEHEMAAEKVSNAFSEGSFGISDIIVSEVYHKLSKFLGREEAKSRMGRILMHPRAEWLEMSRDATVEAIGLSSKTGMTINDALIGMQALKLGASLLTDNLKDFRKLKELKLIPLGERS